MTNVLKTPTKKVDTQPEPSTIKASFAAVGIQDFQPPPSMLVFGLSSQRLLQPLEVTLDQAMLIVF
jgi:hypothetical protein